MRKIQMTVNISLFDREEPRKISVYADANNPYEAACAAFQQVLMALQEDGNQLPSFGVSERHHLNNGTLADLFMGKGKGE